MRPDRTPDEVRDNADLWMKVGEIVTGLHASGWEALATQVDEAQSVSAMPGEVLSEVRFALRQVLDTPDVEESLRKQVQTCLDYLDGQLDGRVRTAFRRKWRRGVR